MILIIFAEPTVQIHPGKRAFNYPPFWQHVKTLHRWISSNNLNNPLKMRQKPGNKSLFISLVGDQFLHPWEFPLATCTDYFGTIRILNVRRCDHDNQQQSEDIHSNMSFSAFRLLIAVEPNRTTNFRCLDTLTIHNSQTWFLVATGTLADHLT